MKKTIVKGKDHPTTKADRMREIVSNYPCFGKIVTQYCATIKSKRRPSIIGSESIGIRRLRY